MRYNIDEHGYYGAFGGAFIPEMLHGNVQELKRLFHSLRHDPSFNSELADLLDNYVGRPSPLYYSRNLSERYRCAVYLKREDLNHTGSHKINNTVGQILLAHRTGRQRIIAETGAGQHGVATATVCALLGKQCVVYMGATDIARQAPNVARMRLLGAEVVPVHSGSSTLKDATNEAIRDWITHPHDTHYIIGSVVGPDPYPEIVTHFQSIIGREIAAQLERQTGAALPDAVIACVGGGSNAAGSFHHFLDHPQVQLIAAEADGQGSHTGHTAATLNTGTPGVLHGSHTYLMQTEDGQIVEPYSISAGLDYPGVGPLHAHLHATGRARYLPVTDREALDAGYWLMRHEGIIAALESAHALAALDKIPFAPTDRVVVCLSGRGDKDLETYIKHVDDESN